MKHILVVTGSRDADRELCEEEIDRQLGRDWAPEIWHGGCPTGADMAAHLRCNEFVKERAFPADWSLGKSAGPLRNALMMRTAAEARLQGFARVTVLALPAKRATNNGTFNAINEALKNGLNVNVRWVR